MASPFGRCKVTPHETKNAMGVGESGSAKMCPAVTKENMGGCENTTNGVRETSPKPHMFVEIEPYIGGLGGGEQPPEIEAVRSLSPSSTTSLSSCSSSDIEKIPKEVFDDTRTVNVETNAQDKTTDIHNETPGRVTLGDMYISKEDLNLVMLDKDSLEEYEMYVEEACMVERRAEGEMRRTLIQEELDSLIRMTEQNDEMDGHEFEPEAVEALGIAANYVCYLHKYYDVPRCQYVFLPSVAHAIMNGSLLEEASKHYFGKSDEFLISYAASLGSTIIATNDIRSKYLNNMEQSQNNTESMEELDLDEGTTTDGASHRKESNVHVSDLFLGVVSPRSAREIESGWTASTKNSKPVQTSRRSVGKSVRFVLAVVLVVSVATYSFLVYQRGKLSTILEATESRSAQTKVLVSQLAFQSPPGSSAINTKHVIQELESRDLKLPLEALENARTTPKFIESPFVVQSSSDSSTIAQVHPVQTIVARESGRQLESSLSVTNRNPPSGTQSVITSRGVVQKERLRRPIVANLLY
jgi:hypothetical protein